MCARLECSVPGDSPGLAVGSTGPQGRTSLASGGPAGTFRVKSGAQVGERACAAPVASRANLPFWSGGKKAADRFGDPEAKQHGATVTMMPPWATMAFDMVRSEFALGRQTRSVRHHSFRKRTSRSCESFPSRAATENLFGDGSPRSHSMIRATGSSRSGSITLWKASSTAEVPWSPLAR